MLDNANLQVKAKVRLLKYNENHLAEGKPPYEIIEGEQVFTGDQAQKIIDQYGGGINGINK